MWFIVLSADWVSRCINLLNFGFLNNVDVCRESSKKVSKKDRKEQRAEFRDVLDFLESKLKASMLD
ncbi:hypothetical protein EON64_21010 [archaeon]|nr:MAG: hypothetical protein EON64_21010 [archaeon]